MSNKDDTKLGEDLCQSGSLVLDERSDRIWFLPENQHCPVLLGSHQFRAIACHLLGRRRLGRDDLDEIEDYARIYGTSARVEPCAALDPHEPMLRVNLGGGRVAAVTSTQIVPERNLAGGVLFVDDPGFEPIEWSNLRPHINRGMVGKFPALTEALLGDLPPASRLMPDEVGALIAAFWLSIFLRDAALARPVLTFLGPPRAGKTMVAEQVGVAFYGESFRPSGTADPGRAAKDLAAMMAHRSLVVRDDINGKADGIVDMLCNLATGAALDLSTFHKTLDLTTAEARAAVIITAFQPIWMQRADLLSRMLLVQFDLPCRSELTRRQRRQRILAARPAIWAETLKALALVMKGLDRGELSADEGLVTRFEDWEVAVRRVASAGGWLQPLDGALGKMERERYSLAINNDPFVALVYVFSRSPEVAESWFTAADLLDALSRSAGARDVTDQIGARRSVLRNPKALSRALSSLERDASMVVIVSKRRGHDNKLQWNIRPRPIGGEG